MDEETRDVAVVFDKMFQNLQKVLSAQDNSQEIPLKVLHDKFSSVDPESVDNTFTRFAQTILCELRNKPLGIITWKQATLMMNKYGTLSNLSHETATRVIDEAFDVRHNWPVVGEAVEIRDLAGEVVAEGSTITSTAVVVVDGVERVEYKTEAGGDDRVFRGDQHTFHIVKGQQGEVYTGQMVEVRDKSGTHILIPASPVTKQVVESGGINKIKTEKSELLRGLGYLSDKDFVFKVV